MLLFEKIRLQIISASSYAFPVCRGTADTFLSVCSWSSYRTPSPPRRPWLAQSRV